MIYTGHNDVRIRRLLATVYWRASPVLHYTAPFLLQQAPEPSPSFPSSFPHQAQQQQQQQQQEQPLLQHLPSHQHRDRRLRIGFFSNFFYHHSVGLLTQGVITGLASPPYNETFHITLVYPTPEEHDSDAVSKRLKEAAHDLCPVPSDNLPAAQRTIAALALDVLVFTEVSASENVFAPTLCGAVYVFDIMGKCSLELLAHGINPCFSTRIPYN